MKYLLLLILTMAYCSPREKPQGQPYGYHEYAVDKMIAERDSLPPDSAK